VRVHHATNCKSNVESQFSAITNANHFIREPNNKPKCIPDNTPYLYLSADCKPLRKPFTSAQFEYVDITFIDEDFPAFINC